MAMVVNAFKAQFNHLRPLIGSFVPYEPVFLAALPASTPSNATHQRAYLMGASALDSLNRSY